MHNMQIARYATATGPRLGLVIADEIVDLDVALDPGAGVDALLANEGAEIEALAARARRQGERLALADVVLLAPVPRPSKVFAAGLNYADHIAEAGLQAPEVPTIFAKFQNTISGPYDPIQRPRVSTHLDYEGELAVVIGRRCRHVPRERAHEVIGGYMVLNDVSVRDWQLQSPQWSISKSFDTHAPTGPWVTLAGTIDPSGLRLQTWVNGDLRQDSNTRELVVDCLDLVAHLSQACTLEPGDIIATGTPGGVGFLRQPPLYLEPDDEVRVEIEGLGALVNRVIDEPADSAHIAGEPLPETDAATAR
jgi:2-keto-4-pentenoate hydratase/2-oxohepta-3-ene-1,7-dioic acid hydratase in catechol pathway